MPPGPGFKICHSRSTCGMDTRDVTEERWERLRPLLPPQNPRRGRPPQDHRPISNGLVWRLRTGAPWRDLPDTFGPRRPVAPRFYRWPRAGIWDRILAEPQQQGAAAGDLDWSVPHVNGTVIRAPRNAAGAQERGSTT